MLLEDFLIAIFGERIASHLLLAPLAINFGINFIWFILKNVFKTSSQYRAAKEAEEAGGTGTFLSIEAIFYLFSFLVTFFILVSINFYTDLNDIPPTTYVLWLPSIASITIGEIAKFFSGLKKSETETSLDRRQRQLSWFFILTIISLAGLWFYMIFGEGIQPFIDALYTVDRFLL